MIETSATKAMSPEVEAPGTISGDAGENTHGPIIPPTPIECNTPDQASATDRLLTHLHRGGAFGYWWVLNPTNDTKMTFWWPADRRGNAPSGLVHVYFGVHPTAKPKASYQRATIGDIAAVNCLFAEFDAKHFGDDKDAAWHHLQALPIPASLIVDSGGGYHAYWLFAKPFTLDSDDSREFAKNLQRRWVAAMGGDDGAKDLARVLRVPGTLNVKPEYGPNFPTVRVIWTSWRAYQLSELEAVLPAPDPMPPRSNPSPSRNGHGSAYVRAAVEGELARVRGAIEGSRNGTLNEAAFAIGQWIPEYVNRSDAEMWLSDAARDCGLPEREAERTIRSGLDAGEQKPRAVPEREPTGPSLREDQSKAVGVAPAEDTEPEQRIDLNGFPMSDAGNAEVIAALFGERLRYDHRRGRWLVWAGHRWRPDDNGEVERLAIEAARERRKAAAAIPDPAISKRAFSWAIGSENRYRIRAALELAQVIPPIATTGEVYDSDPWLLGCENGVIDLRTGELRDGRQSDCVTMSTGVHYDPHAAAPRWERFLDEVFNSRQTLIHFVQRYAGYSATGDIREQNLPLLHGGGSNGKTTLVEALRNALGEYADNTCFQTFEMSRDTQTEDLARLCGRRLVTASETQQDRQLNEARIKAVTGGDPLTARYLYGHLFTFHPSFKLWLSMNHLPVIRGTDAGIWRRICLVPFNVSFEGREDKGLATALRAEAPGILRWIVDGCLAWQRDGLQIPEEVRAATKEYRSESDVVQQLIDDHAILPSGMETRTSDLYKAFREWCKENRQGDMTQTAFGRRLSELGIERDRDTSGNHRVYKGIGLIG